MKKPTIKLHASILGREISINPDEITAYEPYPDGCGIIIYGKKIMVKNLLTNKNRCNIDVDRALKSIRDLIAEQRSWV